MSGVIAFVRRCLASGMDLETALAASEQFEAAVVWVQETPRQARNRRYYEAKASEKRLNRLNSDGGETVLKASESVLKRLNSDASRVVDNLSKPVDTCSSEGKPSSQQAKRGTRLDPAWKPSETETAYALTKGLSQEETDGAAEGFVNYWCSLAGARGVRLDWTRTWYNRVIELADRKRERGARLAARPANASGGGRGASSFADILVRRHGRDRD